ncbi:MAG: hypothetical protein K9M07_02950 [Simkaniaceae bacterium]|nr:hypothetical protein [Simkaniaceae bacterium]MCF7852180.1 hypothetical protein [Simkaniaceae bacterium]
MQKLTIVLFGEAERGSFHTLHYLKTLPQLNETLGNPTENSQAMDIAIQLLMYQRNLVFIRVQEEGYSLKDYMIGLKMIEDDQSIWNLAAIALPGVGDELILNECTQVCEKKRCIMIGSEKDLYDYLTNFGSMGSF